MYKMKFIYFLLCIYYGYCVCANIKDKVLPKGSPCTAHDGRNGTCVDFKNCLFAPKLVHYGVHPAICSFDKRDPVVCCNDCDREYDISKFIVGANGGFYLKTGQKAFDQCLHYMVNQRYPCVLYGGLSRKWMPDKKCFDYTTEDPIYTIHSGIDAMRDQYPHMALLGYGSTLEAAQWFCAGSVISEKYILTAAHCISSPKIGPVKYVALGILKRTDSPELWQRYRVKKITPHPEYKAPSKYHDIALLETEERIKFSRTVLPACVDTGATHDTVAWATGWGALGHNQQLADNLQTAELKEYNETTCSTHYPPHRHLVNGYDHAKQMCYGDLDKDTCEGDSGGPLQVMSEQATCVHLVVGVTSYGKPCGFEGGSGMYTRVSYYVPWIESIVWP